MNLKPRNGGSRVWEVKAFILPKPDVILGATFVVLGKTAKVLWYVNPKAEMEESASGSRSSLCYGVF